MDRETIGAEELEQTIGGSDPEAFGSAAVCRICGLPSFGTGFELGGKVTQYISTGLCCENCLKQELQKYQSEGYTFVRWLR